MEWRRERDSKSIVILKPRKLLILLHSKNAQKSQFGLSRYVRGTRISFFLFFVPHGVINILDDSLDLMAPIFAVEFL